MNAAEPRTVTLHGRAGDLRRCWSHPADPFARPPTKPPTRAAVDRNHGLPHLSPRSPNQPVLSGFLTSIDRFRQRPLGSNLGSNVCVKPQAKIAGGARGRRLARPSSRPPHLKHEPATAPVALARALRDTTARCRGSEQEASSSSWVASYFWAPRPSLLTLKSAGIRSHLGRGDPSAGRTYGDRRSNHRFGSGEPADRRCDHSALGGGLFFLPVWSGLSDRLAQLLERRPWPLARQRRNYRHVNRWHSRAHRTGGFRERFAGPS